MKHKLLSAAFFSAFLLIAPNVKAADFHDNETVDKNKTWTIEFTGEVGFDDATKQSITVTDSNNNKVNVSVNLGQDPKKVLVTAPKGGYIEGESYTLNVGSKAHSSKGTPIKNEHKLHFNIKNNTAVVTFKDKNLEKAVRENLNKPEGDLLKSDMEKVTDLYLDKSDIKDISGMEYFINLEELDLSSNQISDLSPLKELSNLQYLDLSDNNITDISPLKGLTNLPQLSLDSNKIKDINALKGLTSLSGIGLGHNEISDISPLKGLTNLSSISLIDNKISDISALIKSTDLGLLDLRDNQISDINSLINVLKELTDLKCVGLSLNPISDSDKQLLEDVLNPMKVY